MSNYINICKKYFKLGVNNKKLLFNHFFSAFLRSTIVLGIPIFVSRIVDAATNKDFEEAFLNVLFLAINYVLYNLVYHWNFTSYAKNTAFIYTKLQELILKKVSTYDENFTKNISKSYLVNTTSSDTWDLCMFPDYVADAVTHFLSVLFALGILVFCDYKIGLVVVIFELFYQYKLYKAQEKKNKYLTLQRTNQDRISELYSEVIDGNKEIHSFDMQDKLISLLEAKKHAWTNSYFKKRVWYDKIYASYYGIMYVAKIAVYLYIIYNILKGNTTIGFLTLVIGYMDRIESENTIFIDKINNLCNSEVRINRIYNTINYKNKNILNFGEVNDDNIYGMIEFDKVTFKYENTISLKNASFKIYPNRLTAIVGKSGSGKSTIFRLLLRLYKLTSGNIYIDGVSIYDYSKEVYSSNVSVATQKPFIFNMSIKDNLSLVDDNFENIKKACKKVGIHDFIMSLPKRYNTILKEDATDISGGQKQLIALARTLLSKSEILLFDEVTSSLDPNTSKQVEKVLKELKKDHTVVIITHKPNLMKMADDIIVVNNGEIVGKGNHKSLINKNKYYKQLQKNK